MLSELLTNVANLAVVVAAVAGVVIYADGLLGFNLRKMVRSLFRSARSTAYGFARLARILSKSVR